MTELESAVSCFQRMTGLSVVIHDLTNQLWRELPLQQFRHCHAVCEAVKKSPHGEKCLQFELNEFRNEAHRWRKGRLHRCHAGYSEMAMPVFERERLRFVLFAGPIRIDNSKHLDYIAPRSYTSTVIESLAKFPKLGVSEIGMLREQMHQLGSRLRCWVQDQASYLPPTAVTKSTRVLKYVEDHYSEPIKLEDLAKLFGLSSERTRHMIKEKCGMNFSTLLTQTRMKAASALLLNTDLPVGAVAECCGLPDPSGFNRSFKKMYHFTPRQWRQRHGG